MEQEKTRLRKEHRKSRDGCLACKTKRVRCDERKPICSSCLIRGNACHYVVHNRGSVNQQPLRALMPSSIDIGPSDCLPIKWTKRSVELFHHFNRFRLLSQTKAPSEYVQGVPGEDSICYHNGLVMAAMHYAWLRGSYKEIEETYIFHKLEIIRAVNESISKSAPMAETGIVEAINSLSMAEAGVGEITASQVHLNGLVTVFERADPGDRQRYQMYWQISQHLMLMIGTFMAAARKVDSEDEISISFHWSSNEDNNEAKTTAGITPSSTPSNNQQSTPTLVPNSSAAWATAAYLYLNLICFDGEWFPGGHGNPRLLRWLLDWVQVRLEDEYEVATRNFSGELWLWRVVIGAYALTVAGSSSAIETVDEEVDNDDEGLREMANLVDWYTDQLSIRQQATWVPEWEAAKRVLEKIHWLQIPGSHGELVLEKIWQHSVRDGNSH